MVLNQLFRLLGLGGGSSGVGDSNAGRMEDQTPGSYRLGAPGDMGQTGAMPQRAQLLAALLGGSSGDFEKTPAAVPSGGNNLAAILTLLGRGRGGFSGGGGMLRRPGGETPPIRSDVNYWM